jgi:hypothetical protein
MGGNSLQGGTSVGYTTVTNWTACSKTLLLPGNLSNPGMSMDDYAEQSSNLSSGEA